MYPDFDGGSILNLMSSIAKASGTTTGHPEARILPAKDINTKNIVLVVIDAVGALWLRKYARKSFWARHLRGTLTSVFPSNTAVCISTFFTGKAPIEHGVIGWHLYAKEAGTTITPLLWKKRVTGELLPKRMRFVGNNQLFKRMDRKAYVVALNRFKGSPYNRQMQLGAKVVGFDRLDQLAKIVARQVRKPGRKYVYAYWDGFDGVSHKKGTTSSLVRKHFREIDATLKDMAQRVRNTDTTIIVVADHGHIDTPRKNRIDFGDYPRLRALFAAPAGGDTRTRYIYAKKGKQKAV
jgi:predicted AlkP superfamily pyrophosphatase or phosphodiesterase